MSAKQIQQIYQYIQANGNFLTSEKILKEVEKHPEMIWQLIVLLCSKLKNRNIENAYAQMVYVLSDPDKHQRSAKWLKQYMDVRDLAIQLNTNYAIMDYIKPQKDKVINLIYKIIEVSKGVNGLRNQFDSQIVKQDMMTKELLKCKALEEATKNSLLQLIERKKKQRPVYDQKIQLIERTHSEINQKRQDKLTAMAKQNQLKEQFYNKQKVMDELKYQNEGMQIKIEQLKKEIAQNAPEVKKQKRAIEEQYLQVEKQIIARLQLYESRQNKFQNCLQVRRQFREEIIDDVSLLIEEFGNLDLMKAKYARLKEDNDSYKRRKNMQLKTQSDINQQSHDMEIQLQNKTAAHENIMKEKKILQAKKMKLTAKTMTLVLSMRQIFQRNALIRKTRKQLQNKISQKKKHFEEQVKRINQNLKRWTKQVEFNLDSVYDPITELKNLNFSRTY